MVITLAIDPIWRKAKKRLGCSMKSMLGPVVLILLGAALKWWCTLNLHFSTIGYVDIAYAIAGPALISFLLRELRGSNLSYLVASTSMSSILWITSFGISFSIIEQNMAMDETAVRTYRLKYTAAYWSYYTTFIAIPSWCASMFFVAKKWRWGW